MKDVIREKLDRLKSRDICPLQIERIEWLLESTDVPTMLLTHLGSMLDMLNEKTIDVKCSDKNICNKCEQREGFRIQREIDRVHDVISLSDNCINN